jgi:hypothetical protein
VLAHCQSTNGSLASMRGPVRTELVRHPVVLAADARAEELRRNYEANRKRTWDWLDGTDPGFPGEVGIVPFTRPRPAPRTGMSCGISKGSLPVAVVRDWQMISSAVLPFKAAAGLSFREVPPTS